MHICMYNVDDVQPTRRKHQTLRRYFTRILSVSPAPAAPSAAAIKYFHIYRY